MTRTCQGDSAYRSVKSSAVNRKWTAGYWSQAVATLFFFFPPWLAFGCFWDYRPLRSHIKIETYLTSDRCILSAVT